MSVQLFDGTAQPAIPAPGTFNGNTIEGPGPGHSGFGYGLGLQGLPDTISRFSPPQANGQFPGGVAMPGALLGPLGELMQQLLGMLQRFLGGNTGGSERYFGNAQGASTGDPHLSFDGSQWNSMTSHSDLLQSDSIPGGFRIATSVTSPNANGITQNQSASIVTNFGMTNVTMDASGNASILEDGVQRAISPGQTLNVGNGETVSRAEDGSLNVTCADRFGGSIATTLRANGTGGVDVSTSATNVDLGGYLTRGPES